MISGVHLTMMSFKVTSMINSVIMPGAVNSKEFGGCLWGSTDQSSEVRAFGPPRKNSGANRHQTRPWKPRGHLCGGESIGHGSRAFLNFVRGRWGTRSALSMMVPGVEPMLTYRQIAKSVPQLLRWWTACMGSTGSKQPKWNLPGVSWRVATPHSRRDKGTPEDQNSTRGVEIPGSPFGGWMVDQQGLHLWYGVCTDLLAPTKHELVMAVLSRMMANEELTRAELDSALGRLQWAITCCPLTKPFPQAFWQWRIAVRSSGRPSRLLRGFVKLLYNLFDGLQPPFFLCSSEPWWGWWPGIRGRMALQPSHTIQTPSIVVSLQGAKINTPLGFQGEKTQTTDCGLGNVWHFDLDYVSVPTKCPTQRTGSTSSGKWQPGQCVWFAQWVFQEDANGWLVDRGYVSANSEHM